MPINLRTDTIPEIAKTLVKGNYDFRDFNGFISDTSKLKDAISLIISNPKLNSDDMLKRVVQSCNTQRENDYWSDLQLLDIAKVFIDLKKEHPDFLWEAYTDKLNREYNKPLLIYNMYNYSSVEFDPFDAGRYSNTLISYMLKSYFFDNFVKNEFDYDIQKEILVDWSSPDKKSNFNNALFNMFNLFETQPDIKNHYLVIGSFEYTHLAAFINATDAVSEKPWMSYTNIQKSVFLLSDMCLYNELHNKHYSLTTGFLEQVKEKYGFNKETPKFTTLRSFMNRKYFDKPDMLAAIDLICTEQELLNTELPVLSHVLNLVDANLAMPIQAVETPPF